MATPVFDMNFPSSITFHAASIGESRIQFQAGAITEPTPPTGTPPPPITAVTPPPAMPPNPSSFEAPPPLDEAPPVLLDDSIEPAVEVQGPSLPPSPPVAQKRPKKKKHRRQTLLPA